MRFEYDEKKNPILKLEDDGVKITISFSNAPKCSNLKETIIDFLISSYEQKILKIQVVQKVKVIQQL